MPPLPVILLTGFLGSGKTTLLLRWLRESPATGKRLGVVMNEFGAESVDSQLIQRPGLPLQQVAGGCLCCASDNELPNAITRMVKEGACDYLVVETSGLAEPDDVVDVLTDYELLPQIRLQAVVTVVDAEWYSAPSDSGERVLARKQIQFAQVLGLSKCDRLTSDVSDWVAGEMRRLNPQAAVVKLPFGLPDLGELLAGPAVQASLDTKAERSDLEASPKPTHLHTGYRSVTWRFPVSVERSKFEAFLCQLDPKEVIRAKGFVRFNRQREKLFMFQTIWGHHVIDEFPRQPPPDPVAVLIGPHLDLGKYQERLRTLLFGAATQRLVVT
ncbi:MAG TPA: GTP-binding protein [Verrucomicrobiota bacterium]|nr:GTP-binding protein [Verrucomicrobiota bacterium]